MGRRGGVLSPSFQHSGDPLNTVLRFSPALHSSILCCDSQRKAPDKDLFYSMSNHCD